MDSIKKVADIVADIANASNEQATGIEQINKALTQMDEVTQQNSALVEENAATAKTLEHQAKAMDGRVSSSSSTPRPTTSRWRSLPFMPHPRASSARPQHRRRAARRGEATGRAETTTHRSAQARRRGNNAGGTIRRMQTSLATAVNAEPDWKEF